MKTSQLHAHSCIHWDDQQILLKISEQVVKPDASKAHIVTAEERQQLYGMTQRNTAPAYVDRLHGLRVGNIGETVTYVDSSFVIPHPLIGWLYLAVYHDLVIYRQNTPIIVWANDRPAIAITYCIQHHLLKYS